jgi:CRISPR-associated protein Csb2
VLSFRVRYLLGRVAAADVSRGSEKDRGEWPPHPDRLFSALVQAWADLGRPDRERRFLERLASAPPPHVHAKRAAADVGRVSFVPVPDSWKPYYRDPNSKQDKAFSVMGAMRIGRDRKERRFVSQAVELELSEPHATVAWLRPLDVEAWTSEDQECAASLSRLVGYLGHSSSLVALDVSSQISAPALVPDDNGTTLSRVPYEGRLTHLEDAFKAGRRPPTSSWQPYGQPAAEAPAGPRPPWRDMVVLRLVGGPHRLPLVTSQRSTRRLRETLNDIFRAPPFSQEPPEIVSGRAISDGAKTTAPHVAFVPLPDVDHPFASGHLLGVALLLPEVLKGEERRTVLRAIQQLTMLDLGTLGRWELERQTLETPLHGLLPGTWTRSSKYWTTVTPISFDRDPGDPLGEVAKLGVARACERLGLSAPSDIQLSVTPFIAGSDHAREFTLFQSTASAPRRRHIHARLVFAEPVSGPLVIGAGRYLGYGLCRPTNGGAA